MFNLFDPAVMPVVFAGLMGLSILLYVILDGYDLGVGMLSGIAQTDDRDLMVASIGPFWDANETWLVLGIGLLLVAFPVAHGVVLTKLYLPVLFMLIGLIARGVAFEFRAKAEPAWKPLWHRVFVGGSTVTALTQGYMLGAYILGFDQSLGAVLFCLLAAVGLAVGYIFVGATWLIYKTEGQLQRRAVGWAKYGLWGTAAGMAAVSIGTPMLSQRIFDRWFQLPEFIALAPIPLITAVLFIGLAIFLARPARADDALSWVPLAGAGTIFIMGFFGIAYSFYPYVVPDTLTFYDAAASPEALGVILVGAIIVLPVIIGYSLLAHWVFRGKATLLRYY